MTQRRTLGLQLVVLLAGVLVGLALIALHWFWLSHYYAQQKSVWGGLARELVWLDGALAAAFLGLLSVKSKTIVAPLAGVAIAMLTYPLIASMLLPEARLVPVSNVLPPTIVMLVCIFAFFVIATGLAGAQAWLEKRPAYSWLRYMIAGGYALFLTVVMICARYILPSELYLITTITGIVLLGFFAGALFGRFFAVWAGTFVGLVGHTLLVWVLWGPGQFGPLFLLFAVLAASFAFPGAFVGEHLRSLVLIRGRVTD